MRIVVVAQATPGVEAQELLGAVERAWRGWTDRDEIVTVPLSDGAHGLMQALAGYREAPERPDIALAPGLDTAVVAAVLPEGPDAFATGSTAGLAEQLLTAREMVEPAGAIVVGLGEGQALDGGRGLLEALAAHFGSLEEARRSFGRLGIVGPSELPLTGLHGAAAVLRGVAPEDAQRRSTEVAAYAAEVEKALAPRDLTTSRPLRWSNAPGSGLGGGAGFGLLALGAGFESGISFTARAAGLSRRIAEADLAVALVDSLDAASLDASAASLAGAYALDAAIPAVVLTGLDTSSRRSRASVGIAGVYVTGNQWSAADVEELAGRVARTWSRPD